MVMNAIFHCKSWWVFFCYFFGASVRICGVGGR